MGRSKAKQLELEKAQVEKEIVFHFENMMWKHYAAEDMTNEGGYDRQTTSYDSVLNSLMKPTPESFNRGVVTHVHGYLKALEKRTGLSR